MKLWSSEAKASKDHSTHAGANVTRPVLHWPCAKLCPWSLLRIGALRVLQKAEVQNSTSSTWNLDVWFLSPVKQCISLWLGICGASLKTPAQLWAKVLEVGIYSISPEVQTICCHRSIQTLLFCLAKPQGWDATHAPSIWKKGSGTTGKNTAATLPHPLIFLYFCPQPQNHRSSQRKQQKPLCFAPVSPRQLLVPGEWANAEKYQVHARAIVRQYWALGMALNGSKIIGAQKAGPAPQFFEIPNGEAFAWPCPVGASNSNLRIGCVVFWTT